jgi:hypothetical protein
MAIIEALIDPHGRLLRHRGKVRILRKLQDRMEVEFPGHDVSRAFVHATAWRPDGDHTTADAAIAVSPRAGVPDQLLIAVAGHFGLALRIDTEPAEQDEEDQLDALESAGVRTKDWYAWADLMPPNPSELHVIGQAEVPNDGVEPGLAARPPGGNPTTLLLDFRLLQRPGSWQPAPVWKPLRLDRVLGSTTFRRVVVYSGDDVVADLAVDEVR